MGATTSMVFDAESAKATAAIAKIIADMKLAESELRKMAAESAKTGKVTDAAMEASAIKVVQLRKALLDARTAADGVAKSSGTMGRSLQALGPGISDFATQLTAPGGGLGPALRASANNMEYLAGTIHPTLGLVTSLGIGAVALASSFGAVKEKIEDTNVAAEKFQSLLEKLKSARMSAEGTTEVEAGRALLKETDNRRAALAAEGNEARMKISKGKPRLAEIDAQIQQIESGRGGGSGEEHEDALWRLHEERAKLTREIDHERAVVKRSELQTQELDQVFAATRIAVAGKSAGTKAGARFSEILSSTKAAKPSHPLDAQIGAAEEQLSATRIARQKAELAATDASGPAGAQIHDSERRTLDAMERQQRTMEAMLQELKHQREFGVTPAMNRNGQM